MTELIENWSSSETGRDKVKRARDKVAEAQRLLEEAEDIVKCEEVLMTYDIEGVVKKQIKLHELTTAIRDAKNETYNVKLKLSDKILKID